MAGFDPAALSATDVGEPLAGTANADPYKRLVGTKIVTDLRGSFDRGKASAYTVPADSVKTVTGLLRLAARKEDLGVRIVEKPRKDGSVQILFQGKKRAQHNPDARLPRRGKAESDGDWAARVAAWETKTGKKFAERRAELDALKAKAKASKSGAKSGAPK